MIIDTIIAWKVEIIYAHCAARSICRICSKLCSFDCPIYGFNYKIIMTCTV